MMHSFTSGIVGVVVAVFWKCEGMAEQTPDPQKDTVVPSNEWNATVVVVLSSAVLLGLVFYLVINCTDCYKSEVSSENHPAAAGCAGRRWGGAGDFSGVGTDVNSSILGAGITGDVIMMDERDNQPLPYALVPTHVPEAQGFCGYSTADSAVRAGLNGYGATGVGNMQGTAAGYGSGFGGVGGYGGGWGAAGDSRAPGLGGGQWAGPGFRGAGSQLPGAHVGHVMPQDCEDPPPPYFASTYH